MLVFLSGTQFLFVVFVYFAGYIASFSAEGLHGVQKYRSKVDIFDPCILVILKPSSAVSLLFYRPWSFLTSYIAFDTRVSSWTGNCYNDKNLCSQSNDPLSKTVLSYHLRYCLFMFVLLLQTWLHSYQLLLRFDALPELIRIFKNNESDYEETMCIVGWVTVIPKNRSNDKLEWTVDAEGWQRSAGRLQHIPAPSAFQSTWNITHRR